MKEKDRGDHTLQVPGAQRTIGDRVAQSVVGTSLSLINETENERWRIEN